ncbi:TPA: DUF3486 family protein, partial [Klebsiella pneumoniae]|nr:DUF3486 family protein [Klebsiella pneumoniae]HEE6779459.1 DUF3486 family protein [Klebsiella pneumoniae]
EGAEDDQDARSEAVIALIQTELFESIVQLQEAGEEEIDPKKRVELLSKVAKNIATLSRASVNLKKFQADARERIEREAREKLIREQREKLDELGKTGSISREALATVIKAAYDL